VNQTALLCNNVGTPVIPARKKAVQWDDAHPRTAAVIACDTEPYRNNWKCLASYHRRSLAETAMNPYKQLIGSTYGLADSIPRKWKPLPLSPCSIVSIPGIRPLVPKARSENFPGLFDAIIITVDPAINCFDQPTLFTCGRMNAAWKMNRERAERGGSEASRWQSKRPSRRSTLLLRARQRRQCAFAPKGDDP
jgi:hypothetical protein